MDKDGVNHYYHVVVDGLGGHSSNSIDAFLVSNKSRLEAKKLATEIGIKIKQSLAYIPTEEFGKDEHGPFDTVFICDVADSIGGIRIYYSGTENHLPQLRVVYSYSDLQLIEEQPKEKENASSK